MRKVIGLCCFVFAIAGFAHAQNYPARPIRLLVPHAPGGPADIMARLVSQRLTAERLLKSMAGLDITHIPYNGAGLAANAVVANEVSVGSAAVTAPAPLIRAGRLKGIVVTSLQRSPALPDVPTVAESGFAGYEDYTWIAFFAPRGTPHGHVAKLNAEIASTLQIPAVRERLATLGFDFTSNTPEQFSEYLRREVVKWGQVVKDSGARVD